MAQKHLRVLQGFTDYSDNDLVAAAGAVITGLTGNKAYPSLPVEHPALQAAVADFTAAIAATAQGGTTATADKNDKRDVLVKALRRNAAYVQAHCDDNRNTLLSSGYQPGSTTRSMTPLPKPVIVSVKNGHTTQLIMQVQKILNVRTYEVQTAVSGANPLEWKPAGSFTRSRSMVLTNLTPATTFSIRVRAVGASRTSDWSDPVSHMCI